jgi:branched-chain amino acid transport system permease protein
MSQFNFKKTAQLGLISGIIVLSVSAIGMVQTFDERDIITGVLTLGQLLLFSAPIITGYLAWNRQKEENVSAGIVVLRGTLVGFLSAVPVIGLIALTRVWPNIRDSLVNVSPALIEILTFGLGPGLGSLLLLAVMTIMGTIGAAFDLLPKKVQKPLFTGVIWVLAIGLLSEILLLILRPFTARDLQRLLFGARGGITVQTAVIVFIIALIFDIWWNARGQNFYKQTTLRLDENQRKRLRNLNIGLGFILILMLPFIVGTYLTEVLDIVGTFILMGLGLNIVVGFAGLLDLGYVAFFAIGAYTMGLLTSRGELGAGLPFWVALPFCVLASTLAGIILGIPVLRMRGDYLAIVTLGFGEIIRVLAVSDLLKPVIGGAQGILQLGKPEILSFVLIQPEHYYYLILASCLLALFVSWRLRDSRLGRRWMAMREDEDVAEAVGIRLVNTKLLAFAIGAAFSGLAGAIFASRLSSVFPHSFNLLISINVLSLIIVGGVGSLPGVILGAFVLVGLPELLREFAEYRLLFYGILLIATMLLRPEGLWPSPIRKRELHPELDDIAPPSLSEPREFADKVTPIM